MDLIPVQELPPPGNKHGGRKANQKYEEIANWLKEQPGQRFLVAQGLTKARAGDYVQALKKIERIGAASRGPSSVPEGIKGHAVYAWCAPETNPDAF